jgi:hypothetical protein
MYDDEKLIKNEWEQFLHFYSPRKLGATQNDVFGIRFSAVAKPHSH